MTRWLKLSLLVAFGAGLVVGCTPNPTDAPQAVSRINVVLNPTCSADSLCYILTWPASSDAKGAATGYKTTVTQNPLTGGVLPSNTATTAPSISFTVKKPDYGVEPTFTASVVATRRGLSSTPQTTTWKYKRQDAPPPPPGPIVVDSSAIVSMDLWPKDVQLLASSAECRALSTTKQISTAGVVNPTCLGVSDSGDTLPMVTRFCASFKLMSGLWALSANSADYAPCLGHLAELNTPSN